MKRIGWALVLLMGLSACATNIPGNRVAKTDWNKLAGAKVAKVNNIKSLITPGFY